MAKVVVITVSDRAFKGLYEDKTGPQAIALLKEGLPDWDTELDLVADDSEALKDCFNRHVDADWIITAGGTGLGIRDISPETAESWCDRPVPGLAEAVRLESLKETPMAMISRVYAGQRKGRIVLTLPGSPKGCACGIRTVLPVMNHSIKMIQGGGHE